MRFFKPIVKRIKEENIWGLEENDIRQGIVMFDFKGKTDDTDFDLKKGDIIDYKHGDPAKKYGEDCELVSLTQLVCQK